MSDRDNVSSARAEFIGAFNAENLEAMAASLTEDHVGMAPNRPAMRGRDASRQFWREGLSVASSRFTVVPEELEIVNDLAIDRFRWSVDSTPRTGGATAHDQGNCIWIWRRRPDGSWKIARAIWNSELAIAGLWSGAAAATA